MVRSARYGIFACMIGICSFGCSSYASPPEEPRKPLNYQECVSGGGKVLKSYPGQCITSDGMRFIQDEGASKRTQKSCKDTCGNGTCEEIVCMALGCPCPETPATCPQDCK
jgi:hypothetical protein